MKTVYFSPRYDDKVLSLLKGQYSRIFSRVWRCNENRVGVFIHEEYVWRTSSNQTITCVFESGRDGTRSKVTIMGSGGGQGFFGIDWGSQGAGEGTAASRIREITRE